MLTARERLSDERFAKLWTEIEAADPSGQILAAYVAKAGLRAVLALVKVPKLASTAKPV